MITMQSPLSAACQERTRSSLLESLHSDLQKKNAELMSPPTMTSSRSEGSRLIDSMKRAFSSKGRSQTSLDSGTGSSRRPNSTSTPLPSLGEDDRNSPSPVSCHRQEAGEFLMCPPPTCLESQRCQFDPTFLYLLSCSSA